MAAAFAGMIPRPDRIVLLLAILGLHAASADDDLFTGPDPSRAPPKAKTRPDPTPSEWDRMLDEANGPKISIPANALSEEQFRLMRKDW